MKIWKSLKIKTEKEYFVSYQSEITDTQENKMKNNFYKNGVIGKITEDGKFDLSYNWGKYKNFHYIGQIIKEDDGTYFCGTVKPKDYMIIIFKVMIVVLLIMTIGHVPSIFRDITFVDIIVSFLFIFLAFLFFYGLLFLNTHFLSIKIRKKL